MGELTKDDRSGLLGLLDGKGGSLVVPKPFERDVFLFDTHVAGTSHVAGIKELEPLLRLDDRLSFFREPDNPYDDSAIVIKNAGGAKVGYVPKADNVVFSRLMDAGKLLFARITAKEMVGNWLKLSIRVYLRD